MIRCGFAQPAVEFFGQARRQLAEGADEIDKKPLVEKNPPRYPSEDRHEGSQSESWERFLKASHC
jgi:hypothetical protein